jgi:hypothetical protein
VFLNTDWVTVNVAPILINNSESDKKKSIFIWFDEYLACFKFTVRFCPQELTELGRKKSTLDVLRTVAVIFDPKFQNRTSFHHFTSRRNIASQFVRNGREQLTPTVKTRDTIGIFLRRFLFKLITIFIIHFYF